MKLSVVILNYNVRYFLELCLKSVQAAITEINAEIIVVDNNSPDDSCEMVKTLFPNVKLIQNKVNSGFSKGNNIGVADARGEYLCILNPDTVVAEDTFTTLLEFADDVKDVGIIGCRLIDGNGLYLPESKRNVPTPQVSFKKMFGYSESYYANHLKEHDVGEVDILVGAFMIIKKSIYDTIGGFDEDYFMYGEDIDLSYKVLKTGFKNQYFGQTTIIHFKGESTPKDRIYRKRFYNAMQIFYKKHFKKAWLLDIIISLGTKVLPLLEFIGNSENKGDANRQDVVFDNNTMSFKAIIRSFEDQEGLLKIRPKNSKFTIGSSGSKSKGVVRDDK